MVTVEAKAKKWGSSLGIIIPKEIVRQEKIAHGELIFFEIRRKVRARDLFGTFPNWKRSGDELKKEMKRGWK